MRKILFLALFAGLCLANAGIVAAHPSDGLQTYQVHGELYASMGLRPEMGIADLTFSGQYPAPDSLSPAERYILTGAEGPTTSLHPWFKEIYYALASHCILNGGQMPGELNDQVIENALYGGGDLGASLERFKSPLTERYPALHATSFSPGDIYARPLTVSEIQHFLPYDKQLKSLYEKQIPYRHAPNSTQRQELAGPVFYMRIYGLHGTILERLVYEGQPVR